MARRHSLRAGSVFCFLVVAFLWAFFAFNTENADRPNYVNLYELNAAGGIDRGIEPGYQMLSKACALIGLSYNGFQMVLSTLSLGMLFFFAAENAENPAFVMILYGIFPFVLDTIQVRNTLAMCFVTYALKHLDRYVTDHRRSEILKFIVLVLLGASFHIIALVYLIYLILAFPPKWLRIFMTAGFAIELACIPLGFRIMVLASRFFPKMLKYVEVGFGGTKLYTKVLFAMLLAVIFIAFWLVRRAGIRSKLAEGCYWVTLIGFFYYVILIFDVDFFRIYRNLVPFLLVGASNAIEGLRKRENRVICRIALLGLSIGLCYFFIDIYTDNIANILHYNRLWGA